MWEWCEELRFFGWVGKGKRVGVETPVLVGNRKDRLFTCMRMIVGVSVQARISFVDGLWIGFERDAGEPVAIRESEPPSKSCKLVASTQLLKKD